MTRRKPAPSGLQREAIDKAREVHRKRPIPPGVVVESLTDGSAGYRLGSPHRDREAWEVQVLAAFGTRSESVARVFLEQLAGVCRAIDDGVAWRPHQIDLNAVLAIVNGTKPKDELQAALAAQMAGIHMLTMRLMASACVDDRWIDPVKAALAAKLARTFAQQLDTMARQQGRVGKQTIKVRYEKHLHQHVHVAAGGDGRNLGQGRAPAYAKPALEPRDCGPVAGLAALSGEDAIGLAVPGAGGAR